MLDLIGYSTLPEDAKVAAGIVSRSLDWLLTVPWWATFLFAAGSTAWLMWVSWPRQLMISNSEEKQALPPPAANGLTLTAHGEQREATPQEKLLPRVYVAWMQCDFSELTTKHLLKYSVRVYNASNREITLTLNKGALEYTVSANGKSQQAAALPSPQLSDGSTVKIPKFREGSFKLQHSLDKSVAQKIKRAVSTGEITINFDGLQLMASDAEATIRVKTWDAVRVFTAKDYLVSGRVVTIKAETGKYGSIT